MPDFLIVGLGNPGSRYEFTRHNTGFMTVDLLAHRSDMQFKQSSKSPARAEAVSKSPQGRIILLKPLSYMNRSGEAVSKLVRFFKIHLDNILIIHDDLDMDLCRIKLVRSGGAGGHNGVRSVIEALGSRDFPRLKIGIGRPDGPIPVDRYVLSRFDKAEQDLVEKIISTAADAAEHVLAHGIQDAMNHYNGVSIC